MSSRKLPSPPQDDISSIIETTVLYFLRNNCCMKPDKELHVLSGHKLYFFMSAKNSDFLGIKNFMFLVGPQAVFF